MTVSTKKVALLLTPDATTPTASNFLEVQDAVLVQPVIGGGDYSRITGKLNTGNQRFNDLNNVTASFTASVLMRSNNIGAVSTDNDIPPAITAAMQVSGFDEAIDSGAGTESVSYSNSQTPSGGTALVYVDGKKYTFEAGSVVANPTFTFTVGEPAKADFEVSGYLTSAVPINEANPTVTPTSEPLIVVSCIDILTVGGSVIQAKEFSITMNNEIINLYTLGGANKLKSNEISDNGITLTASFYVDSATFDREYADLESQALQSIDIKLGTDANSALVNGKSIHITCGKAETQSVSDDTDENRVYRTATYRINNDSADLDKAINFLYGTFA